VEFGIPAVQSMVQVGNMAADRQSIAIPGIGGVAAGFYGDSSAPARCRLPKKGTTDEALGRSRGGFSSKLHFAVDAQGHPLEIRLGPGEEHDINHAQELLGSHEPDSVIADKGYDSDRFVATIRQRGAEAVIPPRSNRTTKRRWNKRKYKSRNLVERFVNRIKHYRRIATRYEKSARNYLGFVHFASALVTLGVTVNTT
jgi:transposase